MIRYSAVKNMTAAEATALTTHRTSVGTDHANVVTATADIAGGKGPGHFPMATQAVLADATIATYIAQAAGSITAGKAFVGVACTGDRTTEVDVKIDGVSIYTVKPLINAAATTTVVSGTLDATKLAFAAGSVITVVNDYTAGTGGGGGSLVVSVGYKLT
jgi:hypothetical protein